jgi:hypothetical protein
MINDIRQWVQENDHLSLMWCNGDELQFKDGIHYYRILHDAIDVAIIEGFCRWGPDTKYYMMYTPYSKEELVRLTKVCRYLTQHVVNTQSTEIDLADLMDIINQ